MKPLKIFFVAALLSFFALGNSIAQTSNNNKIFYIKTTYRIYEYGICELEPLKGELISICTWWDNGKIQNRVEGTLYGVDTGKEYYVFYTANWNQTSSRNEINPVNMHIYCEGKLVAVRQYIIHYYLDADGNWQVKFNDFTKCF
jgi:hypothetical protein